MHRIDTVTGRRALKARREPYWRRVAAGLHLGFRVLETGDGTWIARRRRDDGGQQYYSLGRANNYDDAEKSARKWADDVVTGVVRSDATVGEVCKSYVEYLKANKTRTSVKCAESCFNRLVFRRPIGNTPLAKLQPEQVRAWLNGQVLEDCDSDVEQAERTRKSKVSANRNLDTLKSALNRALADRLVASDFAWKSVVRFRKVNRGRELFLTREQRNKILEQCQPALRGFCTVLLLTGIRPGDLAKCSVSDFDPNQGTLGVSGKTERGTVTLSSEATQFVTMHVHDRSAEAPLLLNEFGCRWKKEQWVKSFKRAVIAAELDKSIVLYHFRHAAISEFILGGMDSFIVAKQVRTSVQMIEKHYGHIRPEAVRKTLDAVKMF